MKVIVDTDPGTDDALALMMALNSPELDVLGLTTVGGNASLAHTTRNALRLLDDLGRPEVPVHRGAARPLRGRFHYGYYYHGPGGLTVRLPLPKSGPRPIRAHDYIASAAREHVGELVLVALGPLTNIARVITDEPLAKEGIREIVVMGGAVEVPGNVTPYAEFNAYNDPAAAEIVLSSGVPVTLVGLDVCDRVYVERDDDWIRGRSPGERLARRILRNWFGTHGDRDRYSLCDPLAIVAVVQPDLLSYKRATVTVVTEDKERAGQTTASYGVGNVKVAGAVQVDEAKQALRRLLAPSPRTAPTEAREPSLRWSIADCDLGY